MLSTTGVPGISSMMRGMRTRLIPPSNGVYVVRRDQATFRQTPEVVSAFASAWRVLSMLVRGVAKHHDRKFLDTRGQVLLACIWKAEQPTSLALSYDKYPTTGSAVACRPVLLKRMALQAQARCIQRVAGAAHTAALGERHHYWCKYPRI